MRALYVTNIVVTCEGSYAVITFENNNRMTAVKLSKTNLEKLMAESGDIIKKLG